VQLILVVPVVFLLSALFFLAIERPCMDPEWPRKLRQRLLRVPAAPKTLDLIS
jgi:peptidoglycan/LPS O-acetylase OafA/YrhL